MSYADDDDAGIELATSRGRDWPSVRQFNVFLANRLGAMLDLVRVFETTDVKIVAAHRCRNRGLCHTIRIVPSNSEQDLRDSRTREVPLHRERPARRAAPGQRPTAPHDLQGAALRRNQHPVRLPAHDRHRPDGEHRNGVSTSRTYESACNALTQQGFTVFSENDPRRVTAMPRLR